MKELSSVLQYLLQPPPGSCYRWRMAKRTARKRQPQECSISPHDRARLAAHVGCDVITVYRWARDPGTANAATTYALLHACQELGIKPPKEARAS